MKPTPIRIIGIDPGLRNMGWGMIDVLGAHLSFVACGTITSCSEDSLSARLRQLHQGLADILVAHAPQEAAVEETFVNRDPQSALKLGQARGIALVVPALAGLCVVEYSANLVKKTVVGVGHAEKAQVAMMVRTILPKSAVETADAADALAIAICHAQHRGARARLSLESAKISLSKTSPAKTSPAKSSRRRV